MTREEIRAHRVQLAPERISPWWSMLRPFLIARVPELATVLADDERIWEEGKRTEWLDCSATEKEEQLKKVKDLRERELSNCTTIR